MQHNKNGYTICLQSHSQTEKNYHAKYPFLQQRHTAIFFSSGTWLPHDQPQATVEGTASINRVNHYVLVEY